jgi:YebC/PmpR family DNA-binding regulatory protein
MSGHSKWSTIKRQKGANDAKRGALFTKVAREISVAARQGGGDPDANYRLRLAIEKARSVNMPADNIKRTIDKATGGGEGEQFEEIVYEGYGPGGVAVLVEAATDNRNRTAAEVRSIFTKTGGQLAGSGAVAWQFEPRGLIAVGRGASVDADEVALAAIDAGAEDVDTDDDETIEIYTSPGRSRVGPQGARGRRGRGRFSREHDDREADGRARLLEGAPGAAARRAARGPRRRPARDGQLRHPRGRLRRGRRVIILGIDPGTAALGYGIVDRSGGRLRAIDHGCLVTSPDSSLPERLLRSMPWFPT